MGQIGAIKLLGQVVAVLGLCLVLALLLAHPINLATADLGRHIKNGELIVTEWKANHSFASVVYQNTYSYTNSQFSSSNHHWASGVGFFYIQKWFGFVGLSVWYIAGSLLAFVIVFYIALRVGGFLSALVSSLFILPLLAYRDEVRPELWSYVFVGLYMLLLWKYMQTSKKVYLLFLPILQILWTNLHIYFFLGYAVTGAFILHAVLEKTWLHARELVWLLVVLVLASLVSPLGITGLLYPFHILGNYGYQVLENQSIFFLRNLHIEAPAFSFLEINFFILTCGFFSLLARRKKVQVSWAWWLALMGLSLGLFAVRNLALCGFLCLPALAQNFQHMAKERTQSWLKTMPIYFAIVLVILFGEFFLIYPQEAARAHGLGLAKGVLNFGQFIKSNNVSGPIFNNYDVGGLLIYALYPDRQVFVDNRPESYPADFFRNIYVPMQEQETIWQAGLERYNFNAIVFNWHDATPWSQAFLARVIEDQAWAPVYVDNYVLILLRRAGINQNIIDKYELPRSTFRLR